MGRSSSAVALTLFASLCLGGCGDDESETTGGTGNTNGTGATNGTGGAGGTGGSGATGGSGGSGSIAECDQPDDLAGAVGEFVLTPMSGDPYTIRKPVCFHAKGTMGSCPIYNYRIPPSTDFIGSFIDILYDGASCDKFGAEFDDARGHYMFSGTPEREPTEPPPIPPSSKDPFATGSYLIEFEAERGDFEYYWPEREQ